MKNNQLLVQSLLEKAGITVNGDKPYDIRIHDNTWYEKILTGQSLFLGDSYINQSWICKSVDEFGTRIIEADLREYLKTNWRLLFYLFLSKVFNFQSKERALSDVQSHYDIGNDLYQLMLDKRMVYTCGYWTKAHSLDEAQEHKLDLICRKLNLQKGMRVLDIGCGWGSFAKFAAEKYGVHVTGLTISKEQVSLAKQLCRGLPVNILLEDYRDHIGQYHCIVSIGMFEHVGPKNYRAYMKMAHRCLKDDGRFLLHTIGSSRCSTTIDPWIHKHIFPNGVIPCLKQIKKAAKGLFLQKDWHCFGSDYDKTLMAWHENFVKNWPLLEGKNEIYTKAFFRKWTYYLLISAASFRAKENDLWQFVFSKKEMFYEPVR